MKISWLSRVILLTCCSCVLRATSGNSQKKGIMVTTPRVWLTGSREKVCIVSHVITSEVVCDIRLNIINKQMWEFLSLSIKEQLAIPPGGSSCVEVSVPSNISASSAEVEVSAVATDMSYKFLQFAEVTIKGMTKMTIIQTNKPVYKPGDLVFFAPKANCIMNSLPRFISAFVALVAFTIIRSIHPVISTIHDKC